MRLPACLLLAGLLATMFTAMPRTAVSAQTCPSGTSPASTARLGELFLPTGAVPYSMIGVYRYALAPGETMTANLDVPVMYIVESGELHYPLQSWTGVNLGPSCLPDADPIASPPAEHIVSSSGSISVNAYDQLIVTAGQTLVAEHGLVGPLRNGGTVPLVVVQIIVRTPRIDPATGLPIVDSFTAGRERDRAFQIRRKECRERRRSLAEGAPVAYLPVYLEAPEPTPAFTTDSWTSDFEREGHKVPRACHGQNAP